MNPTLSILDLFLHASWVVQAVVLLLALISLISWANILNKKWALNRIKRLNAHFEEQFWSGKTSLNELYTEAKNTRTGPLQRIFASGMREYQKQRQLQIHAQPDHATMIDAARRAMYASYQRENDQLEGRLSFLASVGSVSPYIGLFGTVWGIMHAFTGLSALQQVTLASVAPGIAEALVTTAIGLFAAIPAVWAYNQFARDIDRMSIRLESFMEEFANILQRNLNAPSGNGLGTSLGNGSGNGDKASLPQKTSTGV